MNDKRIINQLELAYSPLSNYEFTIIKNDPMIERALDEASLYVIAQRPVLSFENLNVNENDYSLEFEIHQRGNSKKLTCKLPLIQKKLGSKDDDVIYVPVNFINKNEVNVEPPYYNLYAFSLGKIENGKKEFIIWFSPEKLLQNWWHEYIDCEVSGDFRAFLKYKVHYVGKATKQSILKRLTGHSTLQDILSLERPISYKDLPTQEIAILCFEFKDNLEIQSFGNEASISDMVAAVTGKNYPRQEKIFLDAEKALIKAMQPHYNNEMFGSYPKSKDGLYDLKYKHIVYTIMDPITLEYEHGQILGGVTTLGGDSIVVRDNEIVELYKVQ